MNPHPPTYPIRGRPHHRALVRDQRQRAPSRAKLTLLGGGHRWRANADGNGAVDALMRAVDDALAPLLGEGVALATYDVHATGPGHETKASVSLSVRSRGDADGPLYPGHFVSENVLEASIGAYVDAVNALLIDTGVDIASAVPTPGETDTHGPIRSTDRAPRIGSCRPTTTERTAGPSAFVDDGQSEGALTWKRISGAGSRWSRRRARGWGSPWPGRWQLEGCRVALSSSRSDSLDAAVDTTRGRGI